MLIIENTEGGTEWHTGALCSLCSYFGKPETARKINCIYIYIYIYIYYMYIYIMISLASLES